MSKRTQRFSRKTSTHELAGMVAAESTYEDQALIRQDDKGIFIPKGADLQEIISELEAIYADRNKGSEIVKIKTQVEVPPWEGAEALAQAVQKMFGIMRQLPDPATGRRDQIRIQISARKTIQIPWGYLDLPGLSGMAEMYVANSKNLNIFGVTFTVARKYEDKIAQLVSTMRTIASTQCLHKNQAFSISFRDEGGELLSMSIPSFFELSEEVPIYSRSITESIERNIMVPLMYATELAKEGVSLKRGVLFAGKYGMGKTLLASHIARMALESGWTFIYVKNSAELPDALRFAVRYQPVVVFGEDIDRVAGSDRTDKVNELLNQLDGIDSKTTRMLTVLTTNHADRINSAMKRPGRIDLILRVNPPDEDAAERMLREFGGTRLAPGIDLSEPAMLLAGQSPARIREILQRSVLEVLRRTQDIKSKVVASDLVAMAHELLAEDAEDAQA